ncbi:MULTISPECIES: hypothetical protein [Mycobacterium tuberculosis complex]|uniref:hypothetical protein n=1 Tax=Mycobacterium tuberculosis complex TaxID=77643 RepID=UPI00036D6E13|nr:MULTISPECIES: hypothetical protein [Mycobacterium tuberculosis complex]KAB7797061.1 hypothetical protein F9907_20180 [Mycobacterium tuberculosis]KAB7801372.1 hypothetical protein F9906_06080 [Mycobacterium tuberculosis]KAB7805467.1 hypothetical protein F9908_07035 [Mycobacterium tuberculosis]KAB7815115.1 hypothetical protein F9914_06315 [Mycobacterium tuberculosis]KAB7816193.1 hypothetical protein F9911_10590 [Mycobacterium tuberculosis]
MCSVTICDVIAPAPLPIPRTRSWPAIVVAAIGAVVAVAALIVALTNARPAATPSVPTYTAAETAAAQRQLCDTYKLVARAVHFDTNGNNPAFARIALTNAAAMLDSVETDPALDGRHRDAARALAAAYRTLTAKSSSDAFAEVEYRAALGDVNAKEAAMNEVCADGG